ncbi:NADP-dependent oxidoreductase [Herbiconiux sp. CPCC 203407]|uniref:NADP-dependent oxidoreductase n=1 Tax=Herbiconiux oxytropis TaxID=2970915 RepID=A0AA41XIP4_9MICO|nr:NADP-dependent oxidoreductase [Herbiconiux oxytropis]MCS5721710.1 NADP-dependent oxidoreductase [Herbiconiux oxytropis]MCS5726663.1 NADP-dependent oxidoreductase [Herbiconiux oxytropis]
MKAIGLTRFGDADVLRPVKLPEPHAGAGQVRIEVRAAAVNPVDAIIRSGGFAGKDGTVTEPVVPGMDVAGTIDEIGPGQPAGFDLSIGDSVIGFVVPDGSHGGYSELIVLPSESVTAMPANVDYVEGASFLSNALTAEITLEELDLQPGDTLAVTGATGAVGGYLVERAAQRGLTVIADAPSSDQALVRSFGAAVVLDREADFVAGVLEATHGRGADALADAAILTDAVIGAVRDGGQVAFYLPTDVVPGRGIRVFGSYVMRSNLRHDAIVRLARAVERNELTTRVAASYPAAHAAATHRRLEQGGLRGRQILEF